MEIKKLLARLMVTNKEFAHIIGVDPQTITNRIRYGDKHTVVTLLLMKYIEDNQGGGAWAKALAQSAPPAAPAVPAMPPAAPVEEG